MFHVIQREQGWYSEATGQGAELHRGGEHQSLALAFAEADARNRILPASELRHLWQVEDETGAEMNPLDEGIEVEIADVLDALLDLGVERQEAEQMLGV